MLRREFSSPGRRLVAVDGRRPAQCRHGRVRSQNRKNRLGKRRRKKLAGRDDDRMAGRAESAVETLGQTGQLFDTGGGDGEWQAASLLPDAAGTGFVEPDQRGSETPFLVPGPRS